MKKGDNGSSDTNLFATAATPNRTRGYTLLVVSYEMKLMHTGGGCSYTERTGGYTLLVVSPTRGNSCILEAGRRVPDQLVVAIVQGRCLSQVVSLPQE